MKYNKNEVTGKMRDRIILQNVNRSRSLTGFASESWADTATIWAFAESKLPGSNETIIDGKNTAKNVCDFTIRYISTITEESRVVWGDKLYQVKNLKVSHDRRFISFQGVFYDSYILRGVNVDASVNGIGTTSANLKLIMSVIGQANASASTTATITKIIEVSSLVNANASLSGDISFVQKAQASLLATGTTTADLTVNAPSASLLLDLYPSAAAAYSLRKLRTAYSGSAVRVRRSSDNTEQDIGFDVDGNLDTTALTTFVGAGNGFVTTWYDQSGNANNATQTTQASQPQIVSSGVIVLINTKPGLSFNGSSYRFNLPTISFSLNSISVIGVIKSNNLASNGFAFANPDSNRIYLGFILSSISYFGYGNSATSFNLGASTTNQELHELYSGINSNAYKNANSSTQITSSTANENGADISIGSYGRVGTLANFYNGNIQEIIFYTTNQSSNRTGIETNINTHYAIY
jgi:SPP1 family predicted phage head-tail adaptor